ncbi:MULTISPECIES: DUF4230 domain-containing protein [unclassified Sphingomonas]|uniref:DUF4230 domain-containing protein n=1 Tax=unclassified Sphingomonas TaxID=196159 RepID=UPI0006F60D78|nr:MULTISPECIES: DUF4230 domain-containing protein [unclassified Sphingomonas]KQM57867.1 hypothetical protein ASE65_11925 [Sphingomonas sp. Leaf16]KQN12848.1 hypothetical protein ASE81_05885 [Sphingomonas sp. Leaf29]KQN19735.1 hypothetical protein ASE83_05810 [Sphingomonas sp. Leaf32]
MASQLRPQAIRLGVAVVVLLALAIGGWVLWQRYEEKYAVTTEPDSGQAVTRIITARLSGASVLKVASLSGTLQATASDVRGFGWLRSDQVVKMPYSVDYFVDLGGIGDGQLSWSADTRTLVVDAPDVTVARPNIDEAGRTLMQTNGLYVSREAAAALAQRVSTVAQSRAEREARSPQRLAQARELARASLARVLAAPLAAAGEGDVRVVVTFPAERGRRDGERWDVSTPPAEVLGNRR